MDIWKILKGHTVLFPELIKLILVTWDGKTTGEADLYHTNTGRIVDNPGLCFKEFMTYVVFRHRNK